MCAFGIPNESDAAFSDQAEPDSVDFGIIAAGLAGNGVVSGCAVTAQGSPDMTVAVAVGVIRNADGTTAVVASGNVTIGTADATNPRIDLITVGSTGTKACTAGTAAANPVFPAIPAGSVVLAAVYVPASDTTIATNQITDKRVVLSVGASAGQELDYVEFTGNVSPTATTEATANTVVTGSAVTYDGSTPVWIEFSSPSARPDTAAANRILALWLYEDGSSIGEIAVNRTPTAGDDGKVLTVRRRMTPSAGSRTYSIRASVSAGTGFVGAGAGGTGALMPGYIRITKV